MGSEELVTIRLLSSPSYSTAEEADERAKSSSMSAVRKQEASKDVEERTCLKTNRGSYP